MELEEIRLRIAEAVIEVAPRGDIRDIEEIVKRCKLIEGYIVPAQTKMVARKKGVSNAHK